MYSSKLQYSTKHSRGHTHSPPTPIPANPPEQIMGGHYKGQTKRHREPPSSPIRQPPTPGIQPRVTSHASEHLAELQPNVRSSLPSINPPVSNIRFPRRSGDLPIMEREREGVIAPNQNKAQD